MYRQGGIGALVDLYEQALLEIGKVIEDISDTFLSSIKDPEATDEIQTVLSRTVS
ncbi:hypothetical protein [Flavobacterium caseinilyticum]|uniref:hypothetical protein n=1 Tax=Flavobacterium caseinilyticum TaxID=2541732 RepID=UPI001A9D74DD|nr:hypothetical protein [Flavobacterium caseinilyticum]